MKNKIFLIILLLSLSIALVSADGLRMTLLTPSATFNVNPSIINYWVGVKNNNPFQINISILSNPSLTFQGNTNFSLNPNKTQIVNFSYIATNTTTLSIPVIFQGDNLTYSLSETINIIINGTQPIDSNPIQTSSQGSSNGSPNTPANPKQNSSSINTIKNNTKVNLSENNSNLNPPNPTKQPVNNFYIIWVIICLIILCVILYLSFNKRKNKKIDEVDEDDEDSA